jgi:hypothetical protein
VDLAGSEKLSFSKLEDISLSPKKSGRLSMGKKTDEVDIINQKIQELTKINSSLSILGQCITALADENRTHIPFRSSKLTRILKDSLENGSSILVLICISPSVDSYHETNSTLKVFL